MAYQISYDSVCCEKERISGIRRFILTTVFFMCFVWAVSAFWPEGMDLLKLLLIPGDPDATLRAVKVFSAELVSGFSFTDAAQNFCRAVLEHGYQG